MAKHGVLLERDELIGRLTENRAGIATVDVDGGSLLVEGNISGGNFGVREVSFPKSGAKRVAVAYNPSIKYDKVGKVVTSALTLDDREYFNHKGEVLDYFFPVVGIKLGVHMANIEGSTAPVVGSNLQATDGKGTYSIVEEASIVAGEPLFKVIDIISQLYPTGSLSDELEKVFIIETVVNG